MLIPSLERRSNISLRSLIWTNFPERWPERDGADHGIEDECAAFGGGRPQKTWGRTLENALKSEGNLKDFDEWIAIAKDRSKWRQLTHSIPKPPDA